VAVKRAATKILHKRAEENSILHKRAAEEKESLDEVLHKNERSEISRRSMRPIAGKRGMFGRK
jgi:hypothetical protein